MAASSEMQDVRVVHYGLGPLGVAIAREVARRVGLVSVAAVDESPDRQGRDLAAVAGLGEPTGVVVESSAVGLRDIEADVVLHVAGPDVEAATVELETCLELGLNVITLFSELAYPADEAEDELAPSIDALAREAEVSALALGRSDALLGTLPLSLTALCSRVDRLTVRRRGRPADVGRVSLGDWAEALAAALGWPLDDVDEDEVGGPPGGRHRFVGRVEGRETLVVELVADPDAAESLLEVDVDGEPPLSLTVRGGAPAEQAVATLAVNAIPAALTSEPGLYTLAEVPPVHAWTSLALVPADEEDDEE